MKRQLPGMVDTAINLVPGAATVKVIAKFATKNAKSLYAGFKMTGVDNVAAASRVAASVAARVPFRVVADAPPDLAQICC